MVASTFAIFNSTKNLAPRNNLPPWAISTPQWPQITVLCISILSLMVSLYIMYGYWKGGHKRAEKAAVYWTVVAVITFIFTIIVWAIAAGIMQGSRNSSAGQDIWGWSCKDNNRRKLFQDVINYKLVCRQQVGLRLSTRFQFHALMFNRIGFSFVLSSKSQLRQSRSQFTDSRFGVSRPSVSSASLWTFVTRPAMNCGSPSCVNSRPLKPTSLK